LIDLPVDIEDQCRRYVAACGLLFGAIDLVLSHGAFYFLEINPNGEWGWLQRPHGFPIAAAMCDVLAEVPK
jgi:glutathione synthase/RimK-type ligase-like ATP-grasp enzyme